MSNTTKKEIKAGLWLLAGVIVFFAILLVPQQIERNKRFDILSKEGLITNAIIINKHISPGGKGTHYMMACKYFVDGLIYYTEPCAIEKKDYYRYSIGDTIKVIYSRTDASICAVITDTTLEYSIWKIVMHRLSVNDTIYNPETDEYTVKNNSNYFRYE